MTELIGKRRMTKKRNIIIDMDYPPAILASADRKSREARIKDILARGKVVCFSNRTGGKKFVTKWNPDKENDLTAAKVISCVSPYVCWDAVFYTISEVDEIPE